MPPKRKQRSTSTRGRGKGKGPKRQKKAYSEEEVSVSESDEAEVFDKTSLQRTVKYDFNALINDPSLQHPEFIHTIKPEDLNKDYWMKTGLDHPLHFRCDPKLIGMKVPDSSFSVQNVLDLVGGNRIIEVVEVSNQGSVKMSLQEFVDFYNTPVNERKTLYNVLSLEFSLTPLEDLVKSPSIVREIDWVGNKWPDALRQRWIAFNGRDKKLYTPHHTFPKVQNYCLMSVADCYTDFHIDFSGTSVWYHVLKGKKIFWLIPPTETNFMLYQEFIQTIGDSSFFGKSVEQCHVAVLEPGDTMLIPSGWIHAVYTPEDSLVFGGNFLHSLSCKTQIRVYQCENRLNITRKFRLPYNEELVFYVISDYVKKWTGREYARPIKISEAKMDYVGQRWIDGGGHRKKIEYADFQNGVELDNEMVGGEENGDSTDRQEVKVIAMHAENTLYNRPVFKPSAADGFMDAEEVEEEEQELEREAFEKKTDEEIDELCSSNPLIFYKNSKHDFVRNKCVPDHKLPVGHEQPIEFIEEELEKINPRLLSELEALGQYFRRKVKVEVAEGICQPASLLNVFQTVLKRRRGQLEGTKVEGAKETPKRKYTRHAVESGKFDAAMPSLDSFKMEDFPENFLEDDEPPPKIEEQPDSLEYVPSVKIEPKAEPVSNEEEQEKEQDEKEQEGENVESRENTPGVTRRSSRRAANKANDAIKEEIKEMEENMDGLEEEDEEIDTKDEVETDELDVDEAEPEEMSWRERMELEAKSRGSNRSSETKEEVGEEVKKRKVSKEEKKAIKEKEREKKRKSEVLDAALNSAHGNSKTKKKKPEKPQYVGGLPVAPIQNDPVVANPYNYDPKMEMVKLGTGQLKSAYRKTRNNVELRIEKNLYKLEPRKNSQDETEFENEEISGENAETSHLKEETVEEKSPAAKVRSHSSAEPISIDIFDFPSSSKKKHHGEKSKGHHRHHHNRHSDSHSQSPSDPSPKTKLMSPSVFSPRSNSEMNTPKHTPKERKRSDSISLSAARQAVYLPAVSRQDRMIAEAAQNSNSNPRHSSFSERRPQILTSLPQPVSASRSSSIDTPYTPSAPSKSSWLPSGPSSLRNESFDGSPIDVVSSEPFPSPHTPADSISSPGLLRDITSPPGLVVYHKDSMNGRGNSMSSSRRSSDASYSGVRKSDKIPAAKAIANLHILVNQLKQLNET